MENDIKLKISGMHCGSCAASIERMLKKMDGVNEALVNYATESADVKYESNVVELQTINLAIEKLGFHVVGKSENIEVIKEKVLCICCNPYHPKTSKCDQFAAENNFKMLNNTNNTKSPCSGL